MRVLFYTAAAIAATFATVSQSIKIDSLNSDLYIQENSFSQIDAFQQNNNANNNNANNNKNNSLVEAAKPLQERQVEKVANLVAGAASGQDSTITADRHTVTYRATVPPSTSDDQMQKIMARLQEKVMGDSNASAMINGKPIGAMGGNSKLGCGSNGAMGGVGAMGSVSPNCGKQPSLGSLGSDAANEVRAAAADQKRRSDEAKLENDRQKAEQEIALEKQKALDDIRKTKEESKKKMDDERKKAEE